MHCNKRNDPNGENSDNIRRNKKDDIRVAGSLIRTLE